MIAAIRRAWRYVNGVVRDLLACRSVTAWLSRQCTDFDIINRDWPRQWTFIDPYGNLLYIGAGQHWEVRVSFFFDCSRGRGRTAWQAARRAVRAMNKFTNKRMAAQDESARAMGYKDFEDLARDI